MAKIRAQGEKKDGASQGGGQAALHKGGQQRDTLCLWGFIPWGDLGSGDHFGPPSCLWAVIPLLGGIEDGWDQPLVVCVPRPWVLRSGGRGMDGDRGTGWWQGVMAGGRWHWGIPPAGKRELITPEGGERGPLILPRWVPPSRCLSSLMGSWLSPPSPPPPGLSTPLPAHPPAQQAPQTPGHGWVPPPFSYEAGFGWAPQGEPPAPGWALGPPKVLQVPDVWV